VEPLQARDRELARQPLDRGQREPADRVGRAALAHQPVECRGGGLVAAAREPLDRRRRERALASARRAREHGESVLLLHSAERPQRIGATARIAVGGRRPADQGRDRPPAAAAREQREPARAHPGIGILGGERDQPLLRRQVGPALLRRRERRQPDRGPRIAQPRRHPARGQHGLGDPRQRLRAARRQGLHQPIEGVGAAGRDQQVEKTARAPVGELQAREQRRDRVDLIGAHRLAERIDAGEHVERPLRPAAVAAAELREREIDQAAPARRRVGVGVEPRLLLGVGPGVVGAGRQQKLPPLRLGRAPDRALERGEPRLAGGERHRALPAARLHGELHAAGGRGLERARDLGREQPLLLELLEEGAHLGGGKRDRSGSTAHAHGESQRRPAQREGGRETPRGVARRHRHHGRRDVLLQDERLELAPPFHRRLGIRLEVAAPGGNAAAELLAGEQLERAHLGVEAELEVAEEAAVHHRVGERRQDLVLHEVGRSLAAIADHPAHDAGGRPQQLVAGANRGKERVEQIVREQRGPEPLLGQRERERRVETSPLTARPGQSHELPANLGRLLPGEQVGRARGELRARVAEEVLEGESRQLGVLERFEQAEHVHPLRVAARLEQPPPQRGAQIGRRVGLEQRGGGEPQRRLVRLEEAQRERLGARGVEFMERGEQRREAAALPRVGEEPLDRLERLAIAEQAEPVGRRAALEHRPAGQPRAQQRNHDVGAADDQGPQGRLAPLRRPGGDQRERLLERLLGRHLRLAGGEVVLARRLPVEARLVRLGSTAALGRGAGRAQRQREQQREDAQGALLGGGTPRRGPAGAAAPRGHSPAGVRRGRGSEGTTRSSPGWQLRSRGSG